MKKKKEILLKKLTILIPGKEKEFLEFMGMNEDSFKDWSKLSMDELLESFIEFEEENSGEEIDEEILDEILEMYVGEEDGGGFLGDGVF
jgi:hypothetical protein